MRIGFNARYIQNTHTGVENYAYHLMRHLVLQKSEHDFVFYIGSDKPVPKLVHEQSCEYDVPSFKTNNQITKLLWAHWYLPHAIRRKKVDLFHEMHFVPPVIKKVPTIITVYDLAFLYHPECYTRRTLAYLKMFLRYSIYRADRIIAISEATKRDIVRNYPRLEHDRIHVIHAGLGDFFADRAGQQANNSACDRYGTGSAYILVVSLITPRKNMCTIVRSFAALKRKKNIPHKLVIVGKNGWLFEEVYAEVARLDISDDIVFCGYVPDDDLVALYQRAALFLYPSLYEGFGIPLLEAMACGCPVITSNVSSMPEVVGDAGILVDPLSPNEIATAIENVMYNEALRTQLIKNGFRQVRSFSWRKSAEKMLAIYDSLI